MSRDAQLKAKRNKSICDLYEKLASKTVNGKQLYRHEAILTLVSEKFYLMPLTIQEIVSGNDGKPVVKTNQINLLDVIKEEEEK